MQTPITQTFWSPDTTSGQQHIIHIFFKTKYSHPYSNHTFSYNFSSIRRWSEGCLVAILLCLLIFFFSPTVHVMVPIKCYLIPNLLRHHVGCVPTAEEPKPKADSVSKHIQNQSKFDSFSLNSQVKCSCNAMTSRSIRKLWGTGWMPMW